MRAFRSPARSTRDSSLLPGSVERRIASFRYRMNLCHQVPSRFPLRGTAASGAGSGICSPAGGSRNVMPCQSPTACNSETSSIMVERTTCVAAMVGTPLLQHKLAGRFMLGSTTFLIGGRFWKFRRAKADTGRMVQAVPDSAISSIVGRESMSATMFRSTSARENVRSMSKRRPLVGPGATIGTLLRNRIGQVVSSSPKFGTG
ncbi:hypothetical protein AWB77_01442 [Caballeronia fortuita]|uniref:Uncharacterized protein n=1 Tax=Caballeronia fortuita TaxID=1777138 RepID=A0A158A6T3_9BURK|nr:hypothetical protein AWB77_01442 [Caballeronia fortuita]